MIGDSPLVVVSVIFLSSLVLTLIATPWASFVAYRYGIIDVPQGTLKVHKNPTPYLGGVPVAVVTLVFFFCFFLYGFFPSFTTLEYFLYVCGLIFLLLVGIIDDVFALRPLYKLLGQLVSCVCFCGAGLSFKKPFLSFFLPLSHCSDSFVAVVGCVLTVWWMLSIINAFNLIDIMDGLATTVAFMAGLGMIFYSGNVNSGIVLVPFLGSLAGFFYYNRPIASIYLGDAGSLFIGGIFATAPFIFNWGVCENARALFLPIFILSIPIIEVCSLIVVRTYLSIPFYHGSPHHFALYLKRWGFSVQAILLLVGAIGFTAAYFVKVLLFF